MPIDIRRIIIAVLIAVIVGLLLMVFVGPALLTLKVPLADVVGHGLKDFGWTIGVLAALWYYFRG